MAQIRQTIRIPVRVVRVTKSGTVKCHYCGAVNRVYAGMQNPICWRCRNPF